MSATRYRSLDIRELPQEQFNKKVRNNPYISKIYNYPHLILPHPTVTEFQKLWQLKAKYAQKTHVEIGCGSGSYLFQLSQLFPNHRFLGVELRYKRLVSSAKKLEAGNCKNVLLLKEKGEYLEEYLGKNSIDKLHVNFPDPWAKKSQKKHRLLNLDFFNKITTLLRLKGEFIFKTDHQEYFQTTLEILQTISQFDIIEEATDLHHSSYNEANIETEFEKLFKRKGNPAIGYLKAQLCQ